LWGCPLIRLDSWEPIGHPAPSLEFPRFGISRAKSSFRRRVSDNKTIAVGEKKRPQDRIRRRNIGTTEGIE
jgi:hypothetical protein